MEGLLLTGSTLSSFYLTDAIFWNSWLRFDTIMSSLGLLQAKNKGLRAIIVIVVFFVVVVVIVFVVIVRFSVVVVDLREFLLTSLPEFAHCTFVGVGKY